MNNGDRLREIAKQARMNKRAEIKYSKGYEVLIGQLEQAAAIGQNYARKLSIDVMSLFDDDEVYATFGELQGALETDGITLKAVYDSGVDTSYAIFKFSW